MNGKTPYTPFSTHLSGSARETELRLRNIFSGPKKRPPMLFLALVFSACVFCGNLVSCQNAEAEAPGTPDSSVDTPDDLPVPPDGGIDEEFYALLTDYYRNDYLPNYTLYWEADMPGQPQEWDIMLGPVEYLGSGYAGTQLGSAYTVGRRDYQTAQGGWRDEAAIDTFVLIRGADGAPASLIRVVTDIPTEGLTGEDVVFRVLHDVPNPELALYRDGYPYPLGLRSHNFVSYAADYILNHEPQVEIHEDWVPSYGEGSHWATLSWEGLSAVCHYYGPEDSYWPSIIDVTRADLCTPRGIRVGDSRAAVREAYPELEAITGPNGTVVLWGLEDLEGADALMYDVADRPEVLLFFFEGDTLSRMVLHYTLD